MENPNGYAIYLGGNENVLELGNGYNYTKVKIDCHAAYYEKSKFNKCFYISVKMLLKKMIQFEII